MIWAAFFNFIAFLIFARTSRARSPTASSTPSFIAHVRHRRAPRGDRVGPHHLVVGSAVQLVARAGRRAVGGGDRQGRVRRRDAARGLSPTAVFIVVSPAPGLVLGCVLMAVLPGCSGARRRGRSIARSGGCSSSRRRLLSLGHGGNDAQKTMGIIAALLVANGSCWPITPCRCGSCWRATRRWGGNAGRRLAHRPTMGMRMTSCARATGSARRPAAPSRCSWPRSWAFRSRRLTPSPADRRRRGGHAPGRRPLAHRRARGVGLGLHHPVRRRHCCGGALDGEDPGPHHPHGDAPADAAQVRDRANADDRAGDRVGGRDRNAQPWP